MVTLDAILASLARLEAGQMNLCSAMDLLSQGQARLAANLDENYAKLGVLSRLLDLLSEHQVHIETKVDGLGAGVALAIAELRKDLGKPREVEPLRLSDDMHALFMDLLDELRGTRFALAIRSASPLGGKARSGTKRKRAARRTRK